MLKHHDNCLTIASFEAAEAAKHKRLLNRHEDRLCDRWLQEASGRPRAEVYFAWQ
jgi:hypothetical protein